MEHKDPMNPAGSDRGREVVRTGVRHSAWNTAVRARPRGAVVSPTVVRVS